MSKLIKGEFYRLLHKKSNYIYFAALVLGYILIAFIRSGGFDETSVTRDALTYFNFLPAVAGGFLFSAIYTDDLGSKNLITLVGFGISKTQIILAKLILMTVFSILVFAIAPLLHYVVYAALGSTATGTMMATIYAASLKYMLTTIAFASLSGIVVYGLQRTTFAIVLYILLAFNVISGLLAVLLNNFSPRLADYLMSGITDRILTGFIGGTTSPMPFVQYFIYLAIVVVLSILAFHKAEMEF